MGTSDLASFSQTLTCMTVSDYFKEHVSRVVSRDRPPPNECYSDFVSAVFSNFSLVVQLCGGGKGMKTSPSGSMQAKPPPKQRRAVQRADEERGANRKVQGATPLWRLFPPPWAKNFRFQTRGGKITGHIFDLPWAGVNYVQLEATAPRSSA